MTPQLLTLLRQRLTDTVPALRKIERWNNQVSTQAAQQPLAPPTVYLEFLNVRTATVSRRQECAGTLRVRLLCAVLDLDANAALSQQVYVALQGFGTLPLMCGLDRRNVYQDASVNTTELLVQDFALRYYDTSQADAQPRTKPLAPLAVTITE